MKINFRKYTEFGQQVQEISEFNEILSNKERLSEYKIYSGAPCHSKLLPTKKIAQLLQQCDSRILDLTIATQELNIQEENQAQIQIPPKE